MTANPNTNTAARELPSNDHLRLHLGEMTAQEMRTAKAAYRLALTETLTQQQGGEQEAGDDREYDGAVRGLLHAAKQVDREAWGKGAANISLEAIKALTSAHDYLAALRSKPAASEG